LQRRSRARAERRAPASSTSPVARISCPLSITSRPASAGSTRSWGVRALCEVLRQEVGPEIRATMVCPGATATEFATDPELREKMAAIAMEPGAVAQAIAWALAQPPEIDVGEIVVRAAAQP